MTTAKTLVVDALGEAVNIAAGRAVHHLETMAGRGAIRLSLPRVMLVRELRRLSDLAASSVLIRLNAYGEDLQFRFYTFFDEGSAAQLASTLVDQPRHEHGPTELEMSALAELVNIVGSAFLNTLSTLIKRTIIPSPPLTLSGWGAKLLYNDIENPRDTAVVTLRFEAPAEGFEGRFLVTLSRENVLILASLLGQSTRDAERLFS